MHRIATELTKSDEEGVVRLVERVAHVAHEGGAFLRRVARLRLQSGQYPVEVNVRIDGAIGDRLNALFNPADNLSTVTTDRVVDVSSKVGFNLLTH